jgi:hypothetical protein
VLVDQSILDVLKWVGILAAAGLAIALRVTPRGDGRRAGKLIAGIVVSLGLGFGLGPLGRPVVIVKIPEVGEIEKTRARLYGGRTYAFQDGRQARLSSGDLTLVVNDSVRALTLRTISYGSIPSMGGPTPVGPMSVVEAPYGVDYVGPDEPPPNEVSSEISFSFKYWLTW